MHLHKSTINRFGRRGQPSVSISICRVAVQGGSPRQLTSSRNSQSVFWCGRQTAEHPDPRVSACYLRTRGHQYQGGDTWIVAPVASEHVFGQRTSRRGTHNPSWGGWAAYIAVLHSWRRDHSSNSGGNPASLSSEQFSFWPDRCESCI
jgi:hypothetical protein